MSIKKKFNDEKLYEIIKFCKANNINNYKVVVENNEYLINVDESVKIKNDYFNIPIKFNVVNGNFDCSFCLLESLKNTPKIVDGDFICNNNFLKDLSYAPQFINGNFIANMNFIESFNNNYSLIMKNIDLSDNQLYDFSTILKNIFGNITATTRMSDGIRSNRNIKNQLQLNNINYEELKKIHIKYLSDELKKNKW